MKKLGWVLVLVLAACSKPVGLTKPVATMTPEVPLSSPTPSLETEYAELEKAGCQFLQPIEGGETTLECSLVSGKQFKQIKKQFSQPMTQELAYLEKLLPLAKAQEAALARFIEACDQAGLEKNKRQMAEVYLAKLQREVAERREKGEKTRAQLEGEFRDTKTRTARFVQLREELADLESQLDQLGVILPKWSIHGTRDVALDPKRYSPQDRVKTLELLERYKTALVKAVRLPSSKTEILLAIQKNQLLEKYKDGDSWEDLAKTLESLYFTPKQREAVELLQQSYLFNYHSVHFEVWTQVNEKHYAQFMYSMHAMQTRGLWPVEIRQGQEVVLATNPGALYVLTENDRSFVAKTVATLVKSGNAILASSPIPETLYFTREIPLPKFGPLLAYFTALAKVDFRTRTSLLQGVADLDFKTLTFDRAGAGLRSQALHLLWTQSGFYLSELDVTLSVPQAMKLLEKRPSKMLQIRAPKYKAIFEELNGIQEKKAEPTFWRGVRNA